MRYIPSIEGNEWVTVTTQGNGNLGIDNQRKFKDGVLMLERAIDEWDTPALVHIVLTGASVDAYSLFLHKLKRSLDTNGVLFNYRGCTEVSAKKGQHQHYMIVVDSPAPAALFDLDDEHSILSTACSWTQRAAPSFKVFVAAPKRHGCGGIPLSAGTLQDAAEYLSYIFKVRSKEPGHRYMSSRSARGACPADRTAGAGLADRCGINKTNCLRPTISPKHSTFHVGVHSGARHAHLFGNLGLSYASRHHRL